MATERGNPITQHDISHITSRPAVARPMYVLPSDITPTCTQTLSTVAKTHGR